MISNSSVYDLIRFNFALNTDSYKESHWLQYPPGTEQVEGYIESRGGLYDRTVFFGLQMFVQQYLAAPMSNEAIDYAKAFYAKHMPNSPFDSDGWDIVKREYGGRLPIEIKAVPEGEVVPTGNVLATVASTDSRLHWLGQFAETAILRAIWYPTTVATQSWFIKASIRSFMEKTADSLDSLDFRLHDFGARGASSLESAMIGGAAHLVAFQGSDTVPGIVMANEVYDCDMAAFSVPAAEHSTITAWGREGEVDAYRNMIRQFGKPGMPVAVVSDSYDLAQAIQFWNTELRDEVQRSGAAVVIRPDSGHPPSVVLQTVEGLAQGYGYTLNRKNYKVLNQVRVIQGDGINRDSIVEILEVLTAAGWSAENVLFGMGGALLQKVNRDTQKFAMKASAARVNGEDRDVFKQPVTDMGKASKPGRLALMHNPEFGTWRTVRAGESVDPVEIAMLEPVYCNGEILRRQDMADVRSRANAALDAMMREYRVKAVA